MTKDRTKSRAAIAEEAADWFVEWREATPARADKIRFADWLAESPVHIEEYLGIAKLYGELTHLDPARIDDVDGFVDDTVIALRGPATPDGEHDMPQSAAPQPSRRLRNWGFAATVLVAIAASVFSYIGIDDRSEVYTTGLGEQRSILLDDGSMVSLNTDSGVEVAYTDEQRWIRLTRGEALFDVERDPARPFWVETGSALIRVTGTQFNVYEQNGQTAVTVIEGKVEVAPRASPAAQLLGEPAGTRPAGAGAVTSLEVGDQAVVKSGSAAVAATRIENLEPVTAWTSRRLVFSETPLAEIVAEFNRYNRRRLILDDAAVATLEISGVFGTHDPESLVLFLERVPGVEVQRSVDGSEIRVRFADAER